MRKISANYIYTGKKQFLKYGILILDQDNRIVEVIDTGGNFKEIANLEYYSGILVPGFIDCFCNVEGAGRNQFFQERMPLSDFYNQLKAPALENENDLALIKKSINHLRVYGTAGAADFYATPQSIQFKKQSKVSFRNFLNIDESNDSQRLDPVWEETIRLYQNHHLKTSVFADINKKEWPIIPGEKEKIILAKSTSNPHLKCEEFNRQKTLSIWDDITPTNQISQNSITILSPRLIHFLHGELPKKQEILSTSNLCLGTGNLSIHKELSIFEEMKFLHNAYPGIPLYELINWACINGAKALEFDHDLGSFEPGKKPGVNLITKINLSTFRLTPESKIKVLV